MAAGVRGAKLPVGVTYEAGLAAAGGPWGALGPVLVGCVGFGVLA